MMTLWHGNALRITGSLWRESTDDDGFPSQKANNEESISISWRLPATDDNLQINFLIEHKYFILS